MTTVVVVESPAKAKTINKYLGKDYTVVASYGHIRDLPSKNGSVDPLNNFSMIWESEDRAQKHINDLLKVCKKASSILLATDPDREGEAISWHIVEVLKENKLFNKIPTKRVVFNEITKSAITHAITNPRDLDEPLVQAYLARRALDYLVGFTLSPVLWRKLPGSRSAGRVQSVALRLIVEREEEIEKFTTQEYWTIEGVCRTKKNFDSRLTTYKGKKLQKFDIQDEKTASAYVKHLEEQTYKVSSLEKKEVKRNPTSPFITSTLQQESSRKLGFGASKTMTLAQKLYEGIDIGGETTGLITYMRTDSPTLSQEALTSIRGHISQNFGNEYLPNAPRIFKSKSKNAQEAHEAIRPTDVNRTPESLKNTLDPALLKLYDLIWKRTVASQMQSATLEQVTLDMAADDKSVFRSTGSTLVFDGFLKLYQEGKDDQEDDDDAQKLLPQVEIGQEIPFTSIKGHQHFTQPPPRYGEASLVKKLEELSIGRPSTYASIISVLQDRKYVKLEKKQFIPEGRGRLVTSFLTHFFNTYVQYDFTANLEEELDDISSGSLDWQKVLSQFWLPFKDAVDSTKDLSVSEVIDTVEKDLEKFLFSTQNSSDLSKVCPKCHEGTLGLKLGKFGAFLGCSNYPTCSFTQQVVGVSDEGADFQASVIDNKSLGIDPSTTLEVFLKKGPYGFYFQWGTGTKPKRVPAPKNVNVETLTLEDALKIGRFPCVIGLHPETKEEVSLGVGRFGPYIKYKSKFLSIPKTDDIMTIAFDRCLEIIALKYKEDPEGQEKKTTKKAPAKKATAKKAPAKKTATKKAAPKKATTKKTSS